LADTFNQLDENNKRLIYLWKYKAGVLQPTTPNKPFPRLPELPRGAVMVIEECIFIWRYEFAFHLLNGGAAGAIAVYAPQLGAVIVT